MKNLFIILLFILSSVDLHAQGFKLEPVISFRLLKSENNLMNIDSITAFNSQPDDEVLSFGLKSNFSLGGRLKFSSGIEYFSYGTSYVVYNDERCELCPVWKMGGVYAGVFVLPQQMEFEVYRYRKWYLYGTGGLTPVINIKKEHQKVYTDNRYLSTGVADVINALPNTIKPLYFDYSLGAKVKYRRINLYFQYQRNLSNNIVKPLKVWEKNYHFSRRNSSYVFSLSYDLFRSVTENY